MTCIVGIEHAGKVTIGGDSAGVAGYALTVRADEKVWERDGFCFGFTASFRMGQLLRYSLRLPDSRLAVDTTDDQAVYRWMVREFIDAVRSCLRDGGYLSEHNGTERGGNFLVGWQGRLYEIGGDLQVGRAACGYQAVGCADHLALGALHAIERVAPKRGAERRVSDALEAAAFGSAGVCAPFHIVTAASSGTS